MNPAIFGNLAARHNLVEIAEACRREADVGTMESLVGEYRARYWRASKSCQVKESHIDHLLRQTFRETIEVVP